MKYTWLVEKYLEGELSGEALRKFELDILKKPEVADEVEKIRSLDKFVRNQHNKIHNSVGLIEEFEDFENILNEEEVDKELEALKIKKISTSRKDISEFKTRIVENRTRNALKKRKSNKVLVKKISIYMTAASLFILFSITTYLMIGEGHTDYESIYNQFYTAPLADVERTANLPSDDLYLIALKAYKSGEYSKAFQLFSSIPEEGISNEYHLYKGIAAMEIGKYNLAIDEFRKLESDVYLNHDALWYKSLCYIGLNDGQSAKMILKEIMEMGGNYKNMAVTLHRRL